MNMVLAETLRCKLQPNCSR